MEMETIEGNKITSETLGGVSLSSQPSDDLHKIMKPSSENEVLCDEMETDAGGGAAGDGTVVEKTEVTVVTVIQENKEETFKNQGEAFEQPIAEKNEVKENEKEKEGFFGNFVDGDEGMKVNYSENGGSLVENGSELKSVFEGDLGNFGYLEENTVEDPMDVCLPEQKEKNNENGEEIIESQEDTNKNNEENIKNGEDTNKNNEETVENREENGNVLAENEVEYDDNEEQDEIEEDHDFVVGDFVWGKIKSHPWWPGQIYDPSHASDYAKTLKRKNRLLVAYFGDGSFSWCSPSQLKPFIDSFKEMTDQSDSKKFVNAVHDALSEVGSLVEAELMGQSQTVDQSVVNGGIKEGVAVPKGNTIRVLIDRMQPMELVSILKDYAVMEPGSRMVDLELDFTVVKSWLSVFYYKKGGYLLPEYRDPKCIEGLEDDERSGINGPSESAENGDDKLFQRRKQKSVAELLGDGESVEDEPKVKKVKTGKDVGSGSGAKSSTGVKKERKRKPLVVSVAPESDHESGGGGGGGVEDDTMSPRQRKKSKYLSPPYLSPVWNGKLSGSFKLEASEKVPEMAAKQLEESFKRSSGKRQKRRVREGSDSQDSKDEGKIILNAAVNVTKVLQGLLTAALDPSCFVEKKKLPEVSEFVSTFRSSVFEEGYDRKKENNNNNDKDHSNNNNSNNNPMSLVIEFPAEASLPTKGELSKTYKKFGDLVKKEVQSDLSRVIVVFGNGSDAEAALEMSVEKKPFGDVKYCVTEEDLCVKKGTRKAVVDAGEPSDLVFIEQKLEMMRETVKMCGQDEMSREMKANLESGINEVLDKVGKMREK